MLLKSKSQYFTKKSKNSGQVLVEYILLMVIAIGLSTLMTKKLISRKTGDTGIITEAWNRILVQIGRDVPDCENPDCR
ncbi:MAG: hypothetical protein K0R29_670 [Pseudobdellovibrio sp.]|jgi:uncharacterized membrane-anchored protein|nr:hypothetical protein [Pseudobdellovibrio sp.]